MPTVIARDLSKDDQREKNCEARSDEDAILILLFRRTKSTSFNDIASEPALVCRQRQSSEQVQGPAADEGPDARQQG